MASVSGGNNLAAVVPIPKNPSSTLVDVEARMKWMFAVNSRTKKLLNTALCHVDTQTGRVGSVNSVEDLHCLGSSLVSSVTSEEWALLLKGPRKKLTHLSKPTLMRLGCLLVFKVKSVSSLHIEDARDVEKLLCLLASSFDFVFNQSMVHRVNSIPDNQLLLVNLSFLPSYFFWNPSRSFHCEVLSEPESTGKKSRQEIMIVLKLINLLLFSNLL